MVPIYLVVGFLLVVLFVSLSFIFLYLSIIDDFKIDGNDLPSSKIGILGACPSWDYIVHGKPNDFFSRSCPMQFREGDACVASGTEIIEEICMKKGLINPDASAWKCWRANIMEDTPDGNRRTIVGATYAPDKETALNNIMGSSSLMDEGIYYQDPGWCEYNSKDKKVWGASSVLTPQKMQ